MTLITQQVVFQHELDPLFMTADQSAKTVWEFSHDAHFEEASDASAWGGNDLVFPASAFDDTFNLIFKDPELKAAQQKGLFRFTLTEVEDGDPVDSITLIAQDHNGREKYRQTMYFYG